MQNSFGNKTHKTESVKLGQKSKGLVSIKISTGEHKTPNSQNKRKTVTELNQIQQDLMNERFNQQNPARQSDVHGSRPTGFKKNNIEENNSLKSPLVMSGHSGTSNSSCNIVPTDKLQKQVTLPVSTGRTALQKPKKLQSLGQNKQPGRFSNASEKQLFHQTVIEKRENQNNLLADKPKKLVSAKQIIKQHASPQSQTHANYLYNPDAKVTSTKYLRSPQQLSQTQFTKGIPDQYIDSIRRNSMQQPFTSGLNHTQSVQIGLDEETKLELMEDKLQDNEPMAIRYNLNQISNQNLRTQGDLSETKIQSFTKGSIIETDKLKSKSMKKGHLSSRPPVTPTHKPFLSFKSGLEAVSSRASVYSNDKLRRMSQAQLDPSKVTRNSKLDKNQPSKTKFALVSAEKTNYETSKNDQGNQKPEQTIAVSSMHPGKKIRHSKPSKAEMFDVQLATSKQKLMVKQNKQKFIDQPTQKEQKEIDQAIAASLTEQRSPQKHRNRHSNIIKPIGVNQLVLSPKDSAAINRRQTVVGQRPTEEMNDNYKEEGNAISGFFSKVASFFGKEEVDFAEKQHLINAPSYFPPNKKKTSPRQDIISKMRLETSPIACDTSRKNSPYRLNMGYESSSVTSSNQSNNDTEEQKEDLNSGPQQVLISRTSPQGGRVKEYTECASPKQASPKRSIKDLFGSTNGPVSPTQFSRTQQIVDAFKPAQLSQKQKQANLAAGFLKQIDQQETKHQRRENKNTSYSDAALLFPPNKQDKPAQQRQDSLQLLSVQTAKQRLLQQQSPEGRDGKLSAISALLQPSAHRATLNAQMSPQPFARAAGSFAASEKSNPFDPPSAQGRSSISQFAKLVGLEPIKEKRHGETEYQKRPLPVAEKRQHGSTKIPESSLNTLIKQADEIKTAAIGVLANTANLLKPNELRVIPNPNDKAKISRGGSGAQWSTKTGSGSNSAASPNPPQQQNRNQLLAGLTPFEAMQKYEDELTPFEKAELQQQKFIYTIGSRRIQGQAEVQGKDGFYRALPGEQIGYRYQVDCVLDNGAFGQAIRCLDMRDGSFVCLKMSKCSGSAIQQTRQECSWLQLLEHKDPANKFGIVRMKGHFLFRQHYVISFELLGQNLYRHIKSPTFTGMLRLQLRNIAKELLLALRQIKIVGVIHCDLKPENILFTNSQCEAVKIIDFGSSCEKYESGYSYVQSRFYRAPEVVMGVPYTNAIDMWSLGCILAELHTTKPLFPARDEHELLERMKYTVGMPPQHMIRQANANKRRQFFDNQFNLIRSPKSPFQPGLKEKSYPISKQVYTATEDKDFIDFLDKCLMVDPEKRMTPEMALKHRWIVQNTVLSQGIASILDIPSGKTRDLQQKQLQQTRSDSALNKM